MRDTFGLFFSAGPPLAGKGWFGWLASAGVARLTSADMSACHQLVSLKADLPTRVI